MSDAFGVGLKGLIRGRLVCEQSWGSQMVVATAS